mmetsp:Transcript_25440/g.29052  ORF Transcript_25440/g.29052 Transcript_25440/m.29052 type:complete len:356 (+) Transcript_25440:145-1212(+)
MMTMVIIRFIFRIGLVLATLSSFTGINAFSSTTPSGGFIEVKGSALEPLEKKTVAVLGGGGYLGAYLFGYLQRASSIYGTGLGLGTRSAPRLVCATSTASLALNKVLSQHFILAYAGEQHVKVTDMSSVNSIVSHLRGYSAVVIGTMYALEPRPAPSTYGKSPNDKTLEFYLDKPRKSGPELDDLDTHCKIFENTLEACERCNIQHVFVVETPYTTRTEDGENYGPSFYEKLKEFKALESTYIRLDGELDTCGVSHTYDKGVQSLLTVESNDAYVDPTTTILPDDDTNKRIYREDLAAFLCQTIQSLDWSKSRCLTIGNGGDWKYARKVGITGFERSRVWCANSHVYAERLAFIN